MKKVYKATTSRQAIKVSSDLPLGSKIAASAKLNTKMFTAKSRVKLAKTILITLALILLISSLTGCASSTHRVTINQYDTSANIVAQDESTSVTNERVVKQEDDNVTAGVTASAEKVVSTTTTKPSTSNKEKKTSGKAIAQIEKNTIPAESKPTQDELRLANPPVVGSTAPWYEPTVETVAKAYTSAKPMAYGNNYALVRDGNTLTLVYLVGVKDGIGYWKSKVYITPTKNNLAGQFRVEQNITDATGLNSGQLVVWDEELGAWSIMATFSLARPEEKVYDIHNQRWLAPLVTYLN